MFERVPKANWQGTKTKKQPFEFFLRNRCSWKFRNVHRNTPVLESLFNKGAGLKGCNFIKERLQRRCFPVNVAQFLRIAFSWNISAGCFCKSLIIFTEVWVRTLSNIYDGAFCKNSENLPTIFTKKIPSQMFDGFQNMPLLQKDF